MCMYAHLCYWYKEYSIDSSICTYMYVYAQLCIVSVYTLQGHAQMWTSPVVLNPIPCQVCLKTFKIPYFLHVKLILHNTGVNWECVNVSGNQLPYMYLWQCGVWCKWAGRRWNSFLWCVGVQIAQRGCLCSVHVRSCMPGRCAIRVSRLPSVNREEPHCMHGCTVQVLVITWPRGRWLIYHPRARSDRGR